MKAKNLISRILPTFEQHFNQLQGRLADFVETEDMLFCRNTDESLLQDYKDFLINFPTLSAENNHVDWNPPFEVNYRKENPALYPYCLFTTYFSNTYFGLRQSVEIDSLRFAIGQLQNGTEKDWALGALVATVSALGTTYGGHFAQPLVRKSDDITLRNLPGIIDKRSPSVMHEFTARLLSVAEQSQSLPRAIQTVPGPWRQALSSIDQEIRNEPVLVYIDPPYTREEYSRYYHVLETLVAYTYPSRSGIGLTPKPGERFRSEFFTRVESRMANTLVSVITSILRRGWSCAWSYSDSGVANIYNVISSVNDEVRCDVKSFSAPFIHVSQGRNRKQKQVTEFLIVFSPGR
jgi:hypothetical protein